MMRKRFIRLAMCGAGGRLSSAAVRCQHRRARTPALQKWHVILKDAICFLSCLIGGIPTNAAAPATKPATATLFNGRIEYTPPLDYKIQQGNISGDMAAIYIANDEDGYFAIQVLPENASTNPDAARKIVAQLRISHKKNGQAIDLDPTIEKDPRFVIKIHERYHTKEGKIADETHLYRVIAGRAMELDVQSLSTNADHVDGVRKTGEDVLISARWKGGAKAKG